MNVKYSDAVIEALDNAPAAVRNAFFKQVRFLERNLHHPSLRAKKYNEAKDRWQARVNRRVCDVEVTIGEVSFFEVLF